MKFEEGYSKLEQILAKLNSGEVSLEDSLKYYEEADKLIANCNKQLVDAEQKIQALIKNRDGDVAANSDGSPQMQPFGVS